MKIAFACWNHRIAPVFDITRQLHIIEVGQGEIVREWLETLGEEMPAQRALRLLQWEIQTLVCGAISRSFCQLIADHGIQVIPFVTGDLREVIDAWQNGTLREEKRYIMPGCWRGGRRRPGSGQGCRQEGGPVPGKNSGLAWRMGRRRDAAATTADFCPQCGRKISG
jgi:predicted Fe-Mo cluster-binding NifX family protein